MVVYRMAGATGVRGIGRGQSTPPGMSRGGHQVRPKEKPLYLNETEDKCFVSIVRPLRVERASRSVNFSANCPGIFSDISTNGTLSRLSSIAAVVRSLG
jgi:hypothetical protein